MSPRHSTHSAEHSQEGLARERQRILAENERRRREIPAERYHPSNAAEQLVRATRRRVAAALLAAIGKSLRPDTPCLELGCGSGGWLPDLLAWGVRPSQLHGIEIDLRRAAAARRLVPAARILLADGGRLPFAEVRFDLIVVSTVFTSILDRSVRRQVASEMQRCLGPGGVVLWYDFRVDNPANRNVRGISNRELRTLFPELDATIKSVTLLPPLARLLARRPGLVAALERLPWLRTHLIAVLQKRMSEPADRPAPSSPSFPS